MKQLLTFNEVVAALGGPATVAKMTRQMTSAVSNWRSKRGKFPSKYYVGMRDELARRGYYASPELWGQVALDFVDDETKIAA